MITKFCQEPEPPTNRSKLICSLDDMDEIDSREFELTEGNTPTKGFIVKIRDRIVAYENRCPHAGVELNWQENKFLDSLHAHIQCTLHGALFEIENGRCVWGPCTGQSLKAIDIFVNEGKIYRYSQKGSD